MISKRMLTKWRREALYNKSKLNKPVPIVDINKENLLKLTISLNNKILQMTQELLDQHLIFDPFKRKEIINE